MEKKFTTFEELVFLAPQEVQDELINLVSYEENKVYHPEANAYEHIKILTTRLMITGDIDLILAGLYHDIGKLIAANKTFEKLGKFRAFGHEHLGAEWVMRDVEFIESMGGDVDVVHEIVKNHMRMKQLTNMKKSKVESMEALPTWEKLKIFTRADSMLVPFTP